VCRTDNADWVDSFSYNCEEYVKNDWCLDSRYDITSDPKGTGGAQANCAACCTKAGGVAESEVRLMQGHVCKPPVPSYPSARWSLSLVPGVPCGCMVPELHPEPPPPSDEFQSWPPLLGSTCVCYLAVLLCSTCLTRPTRSTRRAARSSIRPARRPSPPPPPSTHHPPHSMHSLRPPTRPPSPRRAAPNPATQSARTATSACRPRRAARPSRRRACRVLRGRPWRRTASRAPTPWDAPRPPCATRRRAWPSAARMRVPSRASSPLTSATRWPT
jgi:hypothetical protein